MPIRLDKPQRLTEGEPVIHIGTGKQGVLVEEYVLTVPRWTRTGEGDTEHFRAIDFMDGDRVRPYLAHMIAPVRS